MLLALAVGLAVGAVIGFLLCKSRIGTRQVEARADAHTIIEDANRAAETMRREAEIEAKEAALRIKDEAEAEARARRAEITRVEERLDNRDTALDRREEELDERRRLLSGTEETLRRKEEELRSMEAEEMAEADARRIVSTTMERLASDLTSESTVKAIALPSDDMKGRIIGREGRNIRAFEAATGVDVIIDDTPETVVISCFDPVRREIGRVAMERLVQDGRIHPGRIEQVVAKVRKDVEKEIKSAGRQALYDAKITGGMHGDLLRLLGALKYRTSYGQNVLAHSVEVANLCGMMAQELGANVKVARRAALLHDVGKAIDHEVEGTHALIGGRFAKKCGESDDVVRAISAHHHEVEMETVEDVLVATADAVSAARPGARRETTEIYLERLRNLEDIALGHRGVDKAYAIQAGREIRVMVQPSQVDDRIAAKLAYDISKQIEKDLEYPGQIKVTVIRESRVSEVAR